MLTPENQNPRLARVSRVILRSGGGQRSSGSLSRPVCKAGRGSNHPLIPNVRIKKAAPEKVLLQILNFRGQGEGNDPVDR